MSANVPDRLIPLVAVSSEAWDLWEELDVTLSRDVTGILELEDAARTNQPLRRAFVRSCWGHIEGSVYGLAHYVGVIEELTGSQHPNRPAEREGTLKKVKATLKWCTHERLTPGWQPDFCGAGWQAARRSFEVRNRLMHPKNAAQFYITDEDYNCTHEAMVWFVGTVVEIKVRHKAWCKAQSLPLS